MKFTFEAIGTQWEIDSSVVLDSSIEKNVLFKVKTRIEEFDKTYSRFRSDSVITEISHKAGSYKLPADSIPLFSLYKKYYDLTDGLFTPLIGQLLSDAGYDADYSLESKQLSKVPSWEDSIEFNSSTTTLHIKKPVLLDFGAAGKGYLIDIISELLHESGIHDFIIDASGDIVHSSTTNENIRIGLENPYKTDEVIGAVLLSNQSICGSAGNRRNWGKYHHIMNPQTQTSPTNIVATWAITNSAREADALTTCLFLLPPSKLSQLPKCEYLILYANNTVTQSPGFAAELFFA